MTQVIAPAYCANCRHFGDWVYGEDIIALVPDTWGEPLGHSCAAFPAGIPVAVWTGEVRHDRAVDGDNGILFEAVDPDAETPARRLYDDLS